MRIFIFLIVGLLLFTIYSCNDIEPTGNELPIYSISIHSPSLDSLPFNESFLIHIDFDEENELTIHHINVQITTESGDVLYNEPSVAHIHEDSGHYEYHDDFVPNVPPGTQLKLSAKVWGHKEGIAEVMESKMFIAQ